mmetsp:Transcript_15277/g.32218  ORF Transcript_15277/g.32218 Transcript_15277/m.32218 type:complete len:152 (+) Transcript_15277:274-729(+)
MEPIPTVINLGLQPSKQGQHTLWENTKTSAEQPALFRAHQQRTHAEGLPAPTERQVLVRGVAGISTKHAILFEGRHHAALTQQIKLGVLLLPRRAFGRPPSLQLSLLRQLLLMLLRLRPFQFPQLLRVPLLLAAQLSLLLRLPLLLRVLEG